MTGELDPVRPDAATRLTLVQPSQSRSEGVTDWDTKLSNQLERAQQLVDMLERDMDYHVEPLDFELPESFRLSVVMPVYNEQFTIETILARVAVLPIPKEIIVVDDASTDSTPQLLEPLAAAHEMRLIRKSVNEGKGAALRTGFAAATGDIVVVQDADLEYDPRDIPRLLTPILEGRADVVYGSRFLGDVPQDPSRLHRFGNHVLTAASNWFTGLQLTDMETCYKAFRRDVLSQVTLEQNRFGFEPEITAKLSRLNARICEVPIRYQARGYREGKKIGLRDAWNAFTCIARYGGARAKGRS